MCVLFHQNKRTARWSKMMIFKMEHFPTLKSHILGRSTDRDFPGRFQQISQKRQVYCHHKNFPMVRRVFFSPVYIKIFRKLPRNTEVPHCGAFSEPTTIPTVFFVGQELSRPGTIGGSSWIPEGSCPDPDGTPDCTWKIEPAGYVTWRDIQPNLRC